jgi:hypothetical protein
MIAFDSAITTRGSSRRAVPTFEPLQPVELAIRFRGSACNEYIGVAGDPDRRNVAISPGDANAV